MGIQLFYCFFTSLVVSLLGASVAILLGCVIVIASSFCSRISSSIAIFWLTGNLLIPSYVMAGGWGAGSVVSTNGWGNLLPSISPVDLAGKPVLAVLAASWIYAVTLVPWSAILIGLGLERGVGHAWLLARMEGGIWAGLTRGLWPVLRGWLGLTFGLFAGLVSTDMTITNLYQVKSLAELSYQDLISGESSLWPILSSLGLSLGFAWMALRSLRQVKLDSPSGVDIDFSILPATVVPSSNGFFEVGTNTIPIVHRWIAEVLLWTIVTTVSFVPWLNLSLKAGTLRSDGESEPTWHLSKMITSIANAPFEFSQEFYWSICLCASSATLALFLGLVVAIAIGASPDWLGRVLLVLNIGCFFLPGPIVNQLVIGLSQIPLSIVEYATDHTLIAPILCLQFRLLPLVVGWRLWFARQWQLRYAFGWAMDQELALVARLQILWSPIISSSVCIWLLLFALSFGDLSTYLLCLPPGVTTVAMRIFDLLHYGVGYKEAGMLLFISVAGMAVGQRCIRIRKNMWL